MFIGEYKWFNAITYLGLVLAVLALFCLLNGQLQLGLSAFIGSGICDLFDGRFARSFERTPEEEAFGVELDSLCDVVGFAAVPAILFLVYSQVQWFGVIAASAYVFAAVTRLAYFNRSAKADGHSAFFIGVPVTFSAVVFPLVYMICHLLLPQAFGTILPVVGLLMAVAFVTKVKLPKPRGRAYAGFALLALVALVVLLGEVVSAWL